jgi:hypothetical protein
MNAHKHVSVSYITFYIQQILVETLKGLGHEINIFLKVYAILISIFCICAAGFDDFVLLDVEKPKSKF